MLLEKTQVDANICEQFVEFTLNNVDFFNECLGAVGGILKGPIIRAI